MPTNLEKWKFTLITTVIFLIVVNPYTYQLTQKLLSPILGRIASETTGCPTTIGFLLHTIVFTLIIRYTMDLKL